MPNRREGYPDMASFYVDDMTTSPSVDAESQAEAEDSSFEGKSSRKDIEGVSAGTGTARSKGVKRAANSMAIVPAQRDVKRLKSFAGTSQEPAGQKFNTTADSCTVGIRSGTDDGAPDDGALVGPAPAAFTPNDHGLHNIIERILPWKQPGLFIMEICDQLSGERQDPMLIKYNNVGSFRVMIHRALAVMLQQEKVERESATTLKGGRSHRYVKTENRQSNGSPRTDNGENTDPRFVRAATRAEASTECPHAEPAIPTQIAHPEGMNASLPAPSMAAAALHKGDISSRDARVPSGQTPPRLAEADSEPTSEVRDEQRTPQSCSLVTLRSDGPKGNARESIPDERQQMQS